MHARQILAALMMIGVAMPVSTMPVSNGAHAADIIQQAPVKITEETIGFTVDGQKVVGTLTLPDGPAAPVIVMFHGFGGSRNELPVAKTTEGVFSRTARVLAEQRLASLRIDFRGSGESEGSFADTTFEGQIKDGLAALSFIAADKRVAGDRLGILGWSQGGLVVSAVAGRSQTPKAVALWAAVATPGETYPGLLGTENVEKGLKTGDTPYDITMPWGAILSLKQPFFEGIAMMDPPRELSAYKGPLFVAQGTADTTVLPASADKFLAAHAGEEKKWTAEMDHVFNAFTGPETLDRMIDETAVFFSDHLN